MDFMTVLGLIVGFSAVYYTLHVGGIVALLYDPVAATLVFGGTLGATMVTYPWRILRRAPKAYLFTLFPPRRLAPAHYITLLVDLSEKSKKGGIDSIQDEILKIQDPFLVDGLQMVKTLKKRLFFLNVAIIKSPQFSKAWLVMLRSLVCWEH